MITNISFLLSILFLFNIFLVFPHFFPPLIDLNLQSIPTDFNDALLAVISGIAFWQVLVFYDTGNDRLLWISSGSITARQFPSPPSRTFIGSAEDRAIGVISEHPEPGSLVGSHGPEIFKASRMDYLNLAELNQKFDSAEGIAQHLGREQYQGDLF
ncbi:MAG: hypothetical protein E4G99_09085 [Anaerolineales bacterium]|nr:MAG: hypothetical protein E4G99_09085 [Anaerolineales bacterium]